jgi:hypothetical protein
LTGEDAELRGVPIKGLEEEIAEVKQAKKGNDPVIAEPVKSPFETPFVPVSNVVTENHPKVPQPIRLPFTRTNM